MRDRIKQSVASLKKQEFTIVSGWANGKQPRTLENQLVSEVATAGSQ